MLKYILAVLLSVAVSLVFYYRTKPDLDLGKKISLICLRAFTTALVILFLLTPIIYFVRKYFQKPVVILLQDNSLSMGNRVGKTSKKEVMSSSFSKLKDTYQKAGYTVRGYSFADGLKGKAASTFLSPSIEKALNLNSNSNVKRIVVFSDGWFRDNDLGFVRNLDIPLTTIGDTVSDNSYDLEITALRHNRQGYRNEVCLFNADLKARAYTGTAKATFLVDGKPVSSKMVSFKTDPVQTVSFEYRFKVTGISRIEIKINTGENDTNQSNNQYPGAIEILNDKELLVVLTDKPGWDGKFILDTIKENNRWQTQSYVVKSNVFLKGDKQINFQDWDKVSVFVIINQGNLSVDGNVSNLIKSAVHRGAGMLYFGLPIQSLSDVLPFRLSNIRSMYQGNFQFLPAAGVYPAFQIPDSEINQIPPVDYYYLTANTSAETVAKMDNPQSSPAIAFSRSSGGIIIGYALINLWRWQMQSSAGAYRSFITNQLVWLSNKEGGKFAPLYQPGYFMGDQVQIRLSATDETRKSYTALSPRLSAYNENGKMVFSDFMSELNEEYSSNIRISETGKYKFKIEDAKTGKTASGTFIIYPQNREERDIGYNLPMLEWLATQTGGSFMDTSEADHYVPAKAGSLERVEKIDFPLYKKWYLITLFLMSFCLELFFRRRWGLL